MLVPTHPRWQQPEEVWINTPIEEPNQIQALISVKAAYVAADK